jgi:trans-2,3-dihydro-3-hydroxyanthranilate isomerase
MPRYAYRIVNVFVESDTATFGGNPLCVFEDARGLTDTDMQALASQFNLSETTFILPRHVVHALGIGGESLTLSMKAGDIPVVKENGAWTFTAHPHTSRASGIATKDIAAMLGLSESDLSGEARYVDNGSDQLVIPVASLDALARTKPDAALLQKFVRTKLDRYLAYVVARVAPDRFQVRFFFPTKSGLTEDPGTGSACANLGGYLLDTGEIAPSAFTVTQGEFINRLNVLQLALTAERRVRVGGRVLELGRGEIHLPD